METSLTKKVAPTVVSLVKFIVGTSTYFLIIDNRLGLAAGFGLVAIFLDYLDGGLARTWYKIRGGDVINSITDTWQVAFVAGLWKGGYLPTWYVVVAFLVMVFFFILLSICSLLGMENDRSIVKVSRGALWGNSMTAMFLSYAIIGWELLEYWGVGIVVFMVAVMLWFTGDLAVDNINGEL
jgi:phosphatidylglycerophosphate synthase